MKLQSQGWSLSDLVENIAAMYSSLEASLITEQEIKDSIVYRDNRKWRQILALRPAAEKERLHMWHLAIWTLVKRGTAAWNLSKPRWSPKRKTPNQTFSEPCIPLREISITVRLILIAWSPRRGRVSGHLYNATTTGFKSHF